MQAKLLRVLQEREIERLGGNSLKKIDVRIIASTNKDLEEMVEVGEFREDLYYRLNVMVINPPPLRNRIEDIPLLSTMLKKKIASKLGIYVEGISNDAIKCLKAYSWPGNIRELENVIERAINLLDSDLIIKSMHLPERITRCKPKKYSINGAGLKGVIDEVEKDVIKECLIKTNGNKNKTSKLLGISRVSLYKKIEKYKLENINSK